jgi:carbamoyltransferase
VSSLRNALPLVLGLNAAYHETAAAIVRGGEVLFAVEEERLSRVKHGKPALISNPDALPWGAIEACLAAAGTRLRDLDAVAYSLMPGLRQATVGLDPEPLDHAAGFGTEAGEREFDRRVRAVPQLLAESARDPDLAARVRFVSHHEAHAMSAFHASGFERAAVLVVDGIGESATAWLGRGGSAGLERLEEIAYPHSLGMLWERFAVYLGFGEYDAPKVMGLAAYGDPGPFADRMRALLNVPDPGGNAPAREDPPFRLEAATALLRSGGVSGLERLFGPRRLPHEPPESPRFAGLAAALQARTEEALLATARRLFRATGESALAYAGGVALNCVANARLERDGPFERLYVPPAAHDAGTAIGAALSVANSQFGTHAETQLAGHPKDPAGFDTSQLGFGVCPELARPLPPFLGPSFDETAIEQALERAGLRNTPVEEPAARAAELLARGQLVGWFQGALEFGPRALGHRSLLADPRDPRVRQQLNDRIKHREAFRPFAASVLAEAAADWFVFPAGRAGAASSRELMLLTYPIRPGLASRVPAVLHHDATCRLQLVTRESDGLYHELLERFLALTGVPMVLNTSFNDREPIVCSPEDALATFRHTGLDALFLGNRMLLRTECSSL